MLTFPFTNISWYNQIYKTKTKKQAGIHTPLLVLSTIYLLLSYLK